jgi:peptide/nickel transport system permease protein
VSAVGARPLWRFLTRNPLAFFGVAVIAVSIAVALLAPMLPIPDPLNQDLPGRLRAPSAQHWLGTDNFGRDVLSRVVWGGRVSLFVGILSVAIGALVGIALGINSGFFGRRVDQVIMRITDILLSFPPLLLALAICAAMGSSLGNVIVAISIVSVPRFARLVRGSALSVKELEFVEAARALGQGSMKIIALHVLPNVLSPLLVLATLWIPGAILTEASLSFLGLGVMPPTPTWGNIISEGKSYVKSAPWIAMFSGLAIVLVVMAFNFVGDAVRDAFDPRLRGEGDLAQRSAQGG